MQMFNGSQVMAAAPPPQRTRVIIISVLNIPKFLFRELEIAAIPETCFISHTWHTALVCLFYFAIGE